jgi:hypothetical protein
MGTAKMTVALVLDGLVALRTVAAGILREKGKGWIFYAALVYSSPLWIEWASWITIGRHGRPEFDAGKPLHLRAAYAHTEEP